MSVWSRFRRVGDNGEKQRRARDGETQLRAWAARHEGVESFVEPRTTVTDTTMLLVDRDGAWTRRRIAGPAQARRIARSLAIPVYDVTLVGYPQRLRDHDARARILRGRDRRQQL